MTVRRLSLLLVWGACTPPVVAPDDAGMVASDAGEQDPGFTIPPEEWIDGGLGQAGGCYGASLDRFIVRMQTNDSSDAWCASVLFKRTDGGTSVLFPEFGAPQGFQIVDARWALSCGGLELANGELNQEGTRPVHEFNGELTLQGFFMNRPRGYDIDAGIRLAYRLYRLSQRGSLSATCAGP